MNQVKCPGLPSDWVNGWLAALGATVLAPRLRLHWTTDAPPIAVLSAPDADPFDVLVRKWPDKDAIAALPIAVDWHPPDGQDAGKLERQVPVAEFVKRAQAIRAHARAHPQSWTLTSTLTDLCVDENDKVQHAPFDPPGPGTIKWLHHRLAKIHDHVKDPGEWIPKSLVCRATRVKDNGLGFDQTRIGSSADVTPKLTDPVIEVLAFFGLAFLTVRGLGVDARRNPKTKQRVRQRGWHKAEQGGHCFRWPVWTPSLDRDAIDALLDVWDPEQRTKRRKQTTWDLYGVHAAWESVAFKTDSTSDPTRAFGSRRLA